MGSSQHRHTTAVHCIWIYQRDETNLLNTQRDERLFASDFPSSSYFRIVRLHGWRWQGKRFLGENFTRTGSSPWASCIKTTHDFLPIHYSLVHLPLPPPYSSLYRDVNSYVSPGVLYVLKATHHCFPSRFSLNHKDNERRSPEALKRDLKTHEEGRKK